MVSAAKLGRLTLKGHGDRDTKEVPWWWRPSRRKKKLLEIPGALDASAPAQALHRFAGNYTGVGSSGGNWKAGAIEKHLELKTSPDHP